MKDSFVRLTLKSLNKILSRVNIKSLDEQLYTLYYKFVFRCLKKDFQKNDKKYLRSIQKANNKKEKIPFIFWVMWWQGVENAPKLVKNNIIRLQNIVGKENVIIVTKENYKKFTRISNNIEEKLRLKKISFTHWSDIVRFNLLRDNGGYWIDSTLILSNPFFTQFIQKNRFEDFISICMQQKEYHYISLGKWQSWFLGGKKHSELFEYMCLFYDTYFESHNIVIDYFLTDDVIAHFFHKNKQAFNNYQNRCKGNWEPYLFAFNFGSKKLKNILYKFDNNLWVSCQKTTYKFNQELLKDSGNLITYLLKNINL